jgi:hypothetical protein
MMGDRQKERSQGVEEDKMVREDQGGGGERREKRYREGRKTEGEENGEQVGT